MTQADYKPESFEPLGIQIVSGRADGTEISIAEVVEYLDRIRVAASVTPGDDLAIPGIILVSVVTDENHDVVRADGVTREPLSFEACTRSILHHLNTIAVFDDAIVDQLGEGHDPDELPAELKQQIESMLERSRPASMHVLSSRDTVSPGFIAMAAETTVQRAFLDNFTLIFDPSGKSKDASVELSTRGELPLAVLSTLGDSRSVLAKIRVGRRSSTFLIQDRAAQQTLVSTFGIPELEALLRDDSRLTHQAGAAIPAALASALESIDGDSPDFYADTLQQLGLPTEAAAWLDGTAPEAEIVEVEPKSTGSILKDSIVSEFRDESLDSSRFLGGFKRFLRRHPIFAFGYGLTELVLAGALLIFGGELGIWPWVRWVVGVLWLIDGLATTVWAGLLLKSRFGSPKSPTPDESA